ncbi:hypothetical protein APTSU1_001719900 [Apodemus speciosus]|uniref:Uncharacterized protein n=1 Tax=Apodemus speciosus TaxID=105296 RepID=A0ABQ0FS95_APOSI
MLCPVIGPSGTQDIGFRESWSLKVTTWPRTMEFMFLVTLEN